MIAMSVRARLSLFVKNHFVSSKLWPTGECLLNAAYFDL